MFNELALLSAIPLGITLINLGTWSRARTQRNERSLAILIPARNEAPRIERAVRSALNSQGTTGKPRVREVLVYDDDSTDETAALVLAMREKDPRVQLIRGTGLPDGWVGKVNACQRLFEAATSDLLLFMDADVELLPQGADQLVSRLDGPNAVDLISAVPRQITSTFAEQTIVSLLLVTYLAWLPLELVERSRSPSMVAANGQLMALRRDTCRALHGFTQVKDAIVDDVAYVRCAKRLGYRAAFADGRELATCRMYNSFGEVWRGFSKNIAAGLGNSFWAVLVATSLYAVCFIWPYVVLASGALLGSSPAIVLGGVGTLANVVLRTAVALRYDQPRSQILFHPLAIVGLIVIAWNSWLWATRRQIAWSGRKYTGASAQ
jgi:chlorobactene glucosyltransferase